MSKKHKQRKHPSIPALPGNPKADTDRPTKPNNAMPASPLAAIDVGSTSIRMRIAEPGPKNTLRTLDELVHPVNIGADTFRVGRVTPFTMRALCDVIKNFTRVFKEYNVTEYQAVATSAIRDASNQDILLDRVRHETGITLKVLDAVEESRLTYQVLLPFLKQNLLKQGTHTMIFDLGGGSTEIMVLREETLVSAGSRRLGTGRLFHSVSCDDCEDTHVLLASVIRNIVKSTLSLYRAYPIQQCVIINPLLMRIFSHAKRAKDLGGGIQITTRSAMNIIRKCAGLSAEQLASHFSINHSDAEMLATAMLILEQFLNAMRRVKRLCFAEADMLHSLMLDLIAEKSGENPLALFGRQIVNSALGIGERYGYHAEHARQVALLSDQLFVALSGFLDLTARDQLYLHVAAILHDIGMYVSERSHHKHSSYLVRWSEIVGLSESERNLISLITRYHRKATPTPRHPEYMTLTKPERLRVSKLSSLLRIADALDRGHTQAIRNLAIEITDDKLLILARSTTDLAVETSALRSKANLFEDITGLRVKLRRRTE